MNLDKDYWNSMDKESMQNYINPNYLGISTPPFEKQLNALKSRIFQGAKNVELGFWGKGKGSLKSGNITPGMHSKTEREEMRQLAKINEVGLTTHASPQSGTMSGLGRQGFNEHEREKSINEVKRAIDFAADVAEGGPVVLHTGEFQRPIHGVEDEKFKGYPSEEERKTHLLVDDRTGKITDGVAENQIIFRPKWDEKDGKKVVRKDYKGKPLMIENPITGEEEPVYRAATNEKGDIEMERVTYKDFKKEKLEEGKAEKDIPRLFYFEQMKRQMENARGQADEYETHYRRAKKGYGQLAKLMKTFKKLEKSASEEGLERLKQRAAKEASTYLRQAGVESEAIGKMIRTTKKPTELIERAMWEAARNMSYGQEIGSSSRRQIATIKQQVEDKKDIKDYAVEKSADSIARAAMFAYEKEKKKNLKKPLYVSPENIFPEQYGAHPDELKNIVEESRERMIDQLVKHKKMGRSKAKKVARNHIKATLDIGHLNTWRKYFEGTDKEFKKWIINKTKELHKAGVLGHVHLSDNFGYEDEHVSVGEGTAPIKEFAEELKKQGYKGPMIVEAGAQGKGRAWEGLTTAMRHFNSPMYQIEGESVGWGEIESGYFGRVKAGPPYVVGAYAPDVGLPTEHRSWTFWSGVPME